MKRILLVDHPQYTSATFYLWHGLKEIEALSPNQFQVSCYPYIPNNYDETSFNLLDLEWYRSLAKLVEDSKGKVGLLPAGIPAFQKDENLTSHGDTIIPKGFPWSSFRKDHLFESEGKMVQALKERQFDLIVLGNSHRVPTILLGRLKERVPQLPPIVYLDAGERDELNEHWIHVFRPPVVFKQILTPEVKARGLTVPIPGLPFKIYPLPLSSPIVDRDYSINGSRLQSLRERSRMDHLKILPVYYSLGNTWAPRQEVIQTLDEWTRSRNHNRIAQTDYEGFHFVVASSRMAVTMRGSGRDTTRYWEIPLYRTAMIADGTMGCIHPYPFEDGKTAFFYRTPQEIVSILDRELGRPIPGDIERIALAGMEHLERYHSTACRAVFFLDILHRELGFQDAPLIQALSEWKGRKRWDGRPWEGPVV